MDQAAYLAVNLVRGCCNCWKRWEDFRIRDRDEAQTICADRHDLGKWDPEDATPLRYFVKTAAVEMGFQNANSFRNGMLAKCVVGETLVAGHVLCCANPGCHGELATNNRCYGCGKHEPREKPDWRMWQKGQRELWYCGRCDQCGRLSFISRNDDSAVTAAIHPGITCPTCAVDQWKPKMTQSWARLPGPPDEGWDLDAYAQYADENPESCDWDDSDED